MAAGGYLRPIGAAATMAHPFALADVFDPESLRGMMESVFRLTGIGSAIAEVDGTILVGAGWQRDSTTLATEGNGEAPRRLPRGCELTAPIHVDGRHIGNVFVCQPGAAPNKEHCGAGDGNSGAAPATAGQRCSLASGQDESSLAEARRFCHSLAGIIAGFARRSSQLHSTLDACRRTEEELRSGNDLFNQIAEQCNIMLWEVDAQGLYTYVSKGVETVLGYRPEEVVGKLHFYDLHPEEGRTQFKEAAFAVFDRREPFINLENAALSKAGNRVLLLTQGIPRLRPDGSLIGYRGSDSDISEKKRAEAYRDLSVETLSILVDCADFKSAIRSILAAIKKTTGCDAIGMRLRQGKDFPYYSQSGFSADFLLKENSLLGADSRGQDCGDGDADLAALECTCGLVISGRTDPTNPLFTKGGSAWTGNAASLLRIPPEADLRLRPRNRCVLEGYATLALIPIRAGGTIFGILQLNSVRENLFRLAEIQELEGIAAHIGEALVRRLAEEAMAASEKKHRDLIQNLNVGIVVHGPDTEILFFNQVACDILGLTASEMAGRDARDEGWLLVREDGSPMAVDEYPVARVLATGRPQVNAVVGVLAAAEGPVRWMLVNAFPQNTERGELRQVVVTFTDISERRQSDQALRESEQYVKSIFRSVPVGIGVVTARVFKQVNQRLCEMTGYAEEELLEKNSRMLYVDDESYLHVGREKYAQIEKRGSGTVETRWRRKDGTVVDILLSSSPIDFADLSKGVTFSALDITSRKKAEAALRKSEERLRLAMAATRQGWFELNVGTGEVTVSPEYPPMIGYAAETFNSSLQSWLDGIHDEDRPEVVETYARCLRGGATVSMDYRRLTASGEWKWIRSTGKIVEYDEAGAPLRMAGTHADITDFKQAEAEKDKLGQQLIQAQKMESVGRLAGGVAHDFNNMLGVILGYCDLAMLKVDKGGPLHGDLVQIGKAARRSADLTRQLLAFARKQTVAPKILDLNETIEGMLKMLRRLLGERIKLLWSPGGGLGPLLMDPTQVDQVLANLCVNAQDAIADTGRILIETSQVTVSTGGQPGEVDVPAGEYILLRVSDNGSGMSRETLANIFEPFYTTKAAGKGTGLGLATVYGIVKQNGGFIFAASEPGQGATFTIYLPRYEGETGTAVEEAASPQAARGNERILLVEDEPEVLEMSARMLEELGYAVLRAETPGAAMTVAREHAEKIDLLLTDVIMPEMNGRDLARTIGEFHRGIRVMFMSGYTADVISHHGVLDDGVHFIEKPFTLEVLGEKIRQALGRG
jgi:PAS domain S-box-containing protein